MTGGPALIVMGYGLRYSQNGQSGPVGECQYDAVFGGMVAFYHDGSVAWDHNFRDEGNIGLRRPSPTWTAMGAGT